MCTLVFAGTAYRPYAITLNCVSHGLSRVNPKYWILLAYSDFFSPTRLAGCQHEFSAFRHCSTRSLLSSNTDGLTCDTCDNNNDNNNKTTSSIHQKSEVLERAAHSVSEMAIVKKRLGR